MSDLEYVTAMGEMENLISALWGTKMVPLLLGVAALAIAVITLSKSDITLAKSDKYRLWETSAQITWGPGERCWGRDPVPGLNCLTG
jgi:hypothetical protein